MTSCQSAMETLGVGAGSHRGVEGVWWWTEKTHYVEHCVPPTNLTHTEKCNNTKTLQERPIWWAVSTPCHRPNPTFPRGMTASSLLRSLPEKHEVISTYTVIAIYRRNPCGLILWMLSCNQITWGIKGLLDLFLFNLTDQNFIWSEEENVIKLKYLHLTALCVYSSLA